jgi:hypothetical protein
MTAITGYPINLLPLSRCQARGRKGICLTRCKACIESGMARVQNSSKECEPLLLGSYDARTRTFK